MTLHAQVERSKFISTEGIGPTLEDDGVGLVPFDDSLDDGLEDGGVGGVGDTVVKRDVDGVA